MTILRSLDDLVADQADLTDIDTAAPRPPRPMTLECRWQREPGTGRLYCVWEMVARRKIGVTDLH
jgi:hypothetical protein